MWRLLQINLISIKFFLIFGNFTLKVVIGYFFGTKTATNVEVPHCSSANLKWEHCSTNGDSENSRWIPGEMYFSSGNCKYLGKYFWEQCRSICHLLENLLRAVKVYTQLFWSPLGLNGASWRNLSAWKVYFRSGSCLLHLLISSFIRSSF